MRRIHQRGRLMWFNWGSPNSGQREEMDLGLQRKAWRERWGGEKSNKNKLWRLWIFKIKICLMLLGFVSGTFHYPSLAWDSSRDGKSPTTLCKSLSLRTEEIPDGKNWERSLGEGFREPAVGSVHAGDVEGGRWEHPGRHRRDFHLAAILDCLVFHGEFPFSRELCWSNSANLCDRILY